MMPLEERTSVLCKASALRTAGDVNESILATHRCVINACEDGCHSGARNYRNCYL